MRDVYGFRVALLAESLRRLNARMIDTGGEEGTTRMNMKRVLVGSRRFRLMLLICGQMDLFVQKYPQKYFL